MSFLDTCIFPNFNPLWALELAVFRPLFPKIAQNNNLYEPKFLLFFMQIAVSNCYYNFNPCGIFEKMTSFFPILNQDLEQGKLMVAVNSRK